LTKRVLRRDLKDQKNFLSAPYGERKRIFFGKNRDIEEGADIINN